MQSDLSNIDKRIIQSLIKKISFAEIADVIDRPLEEVLNYARDYTKDKDILTKQQQIDDHNILKEKKNIERVSTKQKLTSDAERKKDFEKLQKKNRQAREREMVNNRKRSREPLFKTKIVDYSQTISVRIDAKTIIQVPHETDIKLVKENYLKRIHDSKPIAPKQRTTKEVKKFKPVKD